MSQINDDEDEMGVEQEPSATAERCEAVLREIVRRCNQHLKDNPGADPTEEVIGFGPDWGGNALTVYLDGSHTHVGYTEAPFDVLIEGLYRLLVENTGLSLAISTSRDDLVVEEIAGRRRS